VIAESNTGGVHDHDKRDHGNGPAPGLTVRDHAILDVFLRNEADMAYRRRARMLLDYLELRAGERVLDAGCGMGVYLAAMGSLRRLRLVGVDADADRLAWGRRERVPAGLVRGDVSCLPFRDGAFDKILMTEVLEHLQDDRAGLRELSRVLKPGGLLAISVPHARYPFWWDPISRVLDWLRLEPIRHGPIATIWSNHERLYEPACLAEVVRAAGFSIEMLEETTHYCVPFIHFIVYGIGKPLLELNILPPSLRNNADRFRGANNSGNPLNPINVGLALFRAVDRLNDGPAINRATTFVNVLVKARRHSAPASTSMTGSAG
jgi:ubiquinone/menaquinone biosynthesis C-methylase UbiE